MTDASATGLRVGDLVGDRYRVVAVLGAGGMGTVYRVEHTLMAKEMAIKLLRPELSVIPQIVERFEREARSASRLDNVHIVRVTDFGRAQSGALYLVMELLDGESLTSRLERGALGVGEAFEIVDQMLDALMHAHANGVVHRDLKPDNTMLVIRDGRLVVKILDFGLAKLTSREDENGPNLTQAGMVFGTPRYMAPEQAAAEPIDDRTDLYAVGVILYEMLAGHPPFQHASAMDLLTAHLTQAPPPLELKLEDKELARKVQGVVMRALSKHKKDRYASAAEFREALAECVALAPELFEKIAVPRIRSLSDGKVADTVVRGAVSSSVRPLSEPNRIRVRVPAMLLGAVVALGIAGGLLALRATGSEDDLTSRVEHALGAGDLPAARAILGQLVSKDPKAPKTQVLAGHVAFAEGDLDAATEAYKAAIELDGSAVGDPQMLQNMRRILDKNQKLGASLVYSIALHPDVGAADFLADVTKGNMPQKTRWHAFQALELLKELHRIDVVAYISKELQAAKSCSTRKSLVEKLATVDDAARVLPILKSERGRKSGIFGTEDANGCMSADLDALIAKLEKKR